MRRLQEGFTLVEMIMVITITGIIGSMVAMFLKAPIQQYMDVARRADITDIADTALRRIGRDLRTALPNSVRVTSGGGTVYLEYLETIAGGRYNSAATPADCLNTGSCTRLTTTGNLVTGAAGAASNTLVSGGTITLNTARVVVYNQYNNSGNDCGGLNPSVYCAAASGGAPVITGVANSAANANEDEISFAVHTFLPAGGSPYNRFLIVSQPVTYACTPGGTLTRYWGYAIQPAQPSDIAVAPLSGANHAVLAGNVGATCSFAYDVVAQRSGLVTMNLSITEANPDGGDETVTLYSAAHVSNQP